MGQKGKIMACALVLLTGCAGRKWNIFQSKQVEESESEFIEPRRLTAGFESNFAISISPGDNLGFYASTRSGNSNIWAKKLTGGTPRQVTFHPADDFSPAISPDGDYLAFISRRQDATGDLHIIDLGIQFKNYLSNSESKSEVVSLPLSAEQNPSWFPDSERIVFESVEPTSDDPPRLMVVEVDSRRPEPFFNLRGRNPKISSDGKLVTYMRANAIYVYDLERNKEFKITSGQFYRDGQPYFHSENKGLYFIRFSQDSNQDGLLNGDDLPTVWYVEFDTKDKDKIVGKTPFPILSHSYSGYYPIHHGNQVFFTMLNINNLDVFSLPESGHLQDKDLEKVYENRDIADVLYNYRRRAIHAMNNNKPDVALVNFKREQRELGKLGRAAEAKALERFIQQNLKLEEADKGFFTILSLEAKYGSNLFPTSQKQFAEINPKDAKTLAEQQKLYSKSVELLAVSETLLARIKASRGEWANAIHHLDTILEQKIPDDFAAAALALKASVYGAQGDHNSALQTVTIIFEKYPEQEQRLNAAADAVIERIVASKSKESLISTLGEIRISTQWPEPIKARAHIAQAKKLYLDEKYDLAANEVKVIVDDYNNSDGALYNLFDLLSDWGDNISIDDRSYIHEKLKDKLNANKTYKSRSSKRYILFLMSRASHYNNIKEPALAIKEFAKVLEEDPENVPAHRGIILGYFQKGLLEQKIKSYEERTDDENPAWLYLATFAETFGIDKSADPGDKLDIIDDSIAKLQDVIERDPSVAEYHLTLGWLYYQRHVWGKRYTAEGSFGSKVAHSWRITREFFGANEESWLKDSVDSYLTALYLSRENPANQANIEQNLAEAYYEMGNYPEALRYYLHRITKLKNFPAPNADIAGNLYYRGATCAYQADKMELAVALQKKGLKIYEDLFLDERIALGLDRLAFYQDKAGKFSDSLATYERLLTIPDEDEQRFNRMITLANIARTQIRAKMHQEARTTLIEHLQLLDKIPADHPAFKKKKSNAISVSLGDKEGSSGKLDKNMRLLYAYTLEAENFEKMGYQLAAYDSMQKKRKLLEAMRTEKGGLLADKKYMSEHLAISNNNIGVMEVKLGLWTQAATSFQMAARFSEINDPGEKKNNKPSQINLLNSLKAFLAVKHAQPQPFSATEIAEILNEAESALKSDRIDHEKEQLAEALELGKGITNEFADRQDKKKALMTRGKAIAKKNSRLTYYAQSYNFKGVFENLRDRDFNAKPLTMNERELLRRTISIDCRQYRYQCAHWLQKYWELLAASKERRRHREIKLLTKEGLASLVLSEWENQITALLSGSDWQEVIIASTRDFWTNLAKIVAERNVGRVYILNNASALKIVQAGNDKSLAFALVAAHEQIQKFEENDRITSTSAGIIGKLPCDGLTTAGLLCESADEQFKINGEINHLIVNGQLAIHRQAQHIIVEDQHLDFATLMATSKESIRSVIINGGLEYKVKSWSDYFTADLIDQLATLASDRRLANVFIFNKAQDATAIGQWLKAEVNTPLSALKTPDRVTLYPIGHPGRVQSELKEMAEARIDTILEASDALLDKGQKQAASLLKRQVLYLTRITGDRAWELDLLEELVMMDFTLRHYRSALFFQTERIALLRKDSEQYPEVVLNAGILAVRSEEKERAEQYLKESEQLYKGNNSQLAKVFYYYALHYEQQRQYKDAIKAYSSSREYSLAAGEKFLASQRLLNLATLYKERTNEFGKAIKYYRMATDEFAEQDEFESRFRASLDFANTYLTMGRTGQAIDLLEGLAEDAEDTGPQDQLNYFQFMANAYYRSGQYQKANIMLNKIFQSVSEIENVEQQTLIELNATNLQAMVIAKLGDNEKGLSILRQGIKQAEQFGFEAHSATRYNNIGYLLRELGRYGDSVGSFSKALIIDRKLRSRENVAFDNRNLGLSYILMRRFDTARKHLEESLKESESLGLNYNTAYCHFGLADLEREQSNFTKAYEHYEKALAIAEKSFLQDFIWKAYAGMAVAQDVLRQEKKALASFEKALTIIERLRAGLVSTSAKTGFQSDAGVQSVYEGYVDLLMKMGQQQKAWEISERARARAFIDSMGIQHIKIGDAATQELVKQKQALQDELETLQVAFSDSDSRTEKAKLQDEISKKSAEFTTINAQILEKAPEISQFSTVRVIDLKEVQAQLAADQRIVEYYLTHKNVHIWVIGQQSFSGYTTNIAREKLAELTGKFHNLLQNYASMRFNINDLTQSLIQPIAADLAAAKSVVIIPHNFLHHLPFAALNFKEGDYLIDHFNISFLESASMLQFIPLNKTLVKDNILVVGNPDRGEALDLPFAAKEAHAIKRYFPSSQIFTAKEAKLNKFTQLAPNANMIHLASHGVFDNINPMESKLLLAPSRNDPGDLRVKDLFAIKLQASLITLSACETGLGKVTTGDEVIGLNRAFFFAGADSLISALWRISDVASAITMKRFYRYLAEGHSRTEALRKAQLLVRSYFDHPAYWAPFKLTGAN